MSGTYNGNSLAMNMTRAVQSYVNDITQKELECISKYIHDGCKAVVEKTGLNAIVQYLGNKGCITFIKKDSSVKSIAHYQEYIRNVDLVMEQLLVFWMLNRGVWWQPRDEWSVSYQHTLEDADKLIENFALFADAVKDLEHEDISEDNECSEGKRRYAP